MENDVLAEEMLLMGQDICSSFNRKCACSSWQIFPKLLFGLVSSMACTADTKTGHSPWPGKVLHWGFRAGPLPLPGKHQQCRRGFIPSPTRASGSLCTAVPQLCREAGQYAATHSTTCTILARWTWCSVSSRVSRGSGLPSQMLIF